MSSQVRVLARSSRRYSGRLEPTSFVFGVNVPITAGLYLLESHREAFAEASRRCLLLPSTAPRHPARSNAAVVNRSIAWAATRPARPQCAPSPSGLGSAGRARFRPCR